MPRKHYKPEEVIKLLRLVEIEVGQGRTTGQACKQFGFTEQSCDLWMGLKVQAVWYGVFEFDEASLEFNWIQRHPYRIKQNSAE